MAIFRAGKRLGPFDIRGGISRGDFKQSAYHKTESDPRFRMKANTDNTIGRFRASMAAAEGYARAARFAIRVFPPVNLEDQIRARIKQEGFDQKGPSLLDQMRADPENIGMARGGIMDINQMIRPIGR